MDTGEIKREILVDERLYSRQAVKLAANIYADEMKVTLSRSGKFLRIRISGENESKMGEFLNEALNQQCRLDLHGKNGKVAQIIVTKALLSAMGENVKERLV